MANQKRYFDPLLLKSLRDKRSYKKVINMLQRFCEDEYPLKLSELVDGSQATLLHYAAAYGNQNIARYLLKSNCHIDAQDQQGNSPLMLAVQKDHEEVLKILLKSNANIHLTDHRGKSALQLIVDSRNPVMLTTFFRHVAWQRMNEGIAAEDLAEKLEKAGYTAKDALFLGSVELLKVLLNHDGAIDAREYGTNTTLLHTAVQSGMMEMTKVLVDCGADVDALDCWNATPLYYLCDGDKVNASPEFLKMLKVLVSRATSLTTSTDHGPMQIRNALVCGSRVVVEVILSGKIDLDVADGWGHTARDYLGWNCNVNVSKLMRD